MIDTEVVVGEALKLACQRDELVAKLAVVARAVSSRTAVQILAGVLLRAEDGQLHLAATDMELSLRSSLEANVEQEGSAVVPGRLLVDLARLLPAEEVHIEHKPEEGTVLVVCGSATYRLHTYAAEDFPRLPEVESAPTFSVAADVLLSTVAQVARAASRDESRPVLTGILARFERGTLVMAATDSYRLAVKHTSLGESEQELEAIVPARALTELGRIAADAGEVEIAVHENQLVFHVRDVVLTTRRIDGQFPNYKQLLPETFEHVVTLPRRELLDVVRRASVMAQRNTPLRLRFSEGELRVSAQTQDVGEASESLPVGWEGDAVEIGFNAEFLREGLESVHSEDVQLKLISPLRPGLIQGEGDDFSYLIMPIRLAG
ncbi:MAG TPA: DNA polymerase III subunit beta [Gaiellaceae bacterium]|nr:DNA polymerase III subunit beta [Gaiellaceae bacterium]